MNIVEKLSEEDMFGRFYLKKVPDEGPYKNYHMSLKAVRPLVKSSDWMRAVTGYYINAPVTRDMVRLSFFTSHPKETKKVVERFISEHKIEQAQEPELPHAAVISQLYGGEEIRFRRLLALSTLIMLDVIESDPLYSRLLFATFRYYFMSLREPYEKHFLKAFEKKSPTYRSLSEQDKHQFWLDLKHWPNPPQVDWIHLPVNMVLGCDINSFGKWQEFISSNYTLSPKDIDYMLEAQGLKIPGNWQP